MNVDSEENEELLDKLDPKAQLEGKETEEE